MIDFTAQDLEALLYLIVSLGVVAMAIQASIPFNERKKQRGTK